MPPNSIFTTSMAKTPPTAGIQSGAVEYKLIASTSPVTTADKSPIVTGSFISFSYMNSVRTHEDTLITLINSARQPKYIYPKIIAGDMAIITSSMIFMVVFDDLICGDMDTFNVFIFSPPLSSFSPRE